MEATQSSTKQSQQSGWGVLTHRNQHLAKPNHIIILFSPQDPEKLKKKRSAKGNAECGCCCSVFFIAGGIVLLVFGILYKWVELIVLGGIFLVLFPLCVICSRKASKSAKTIDPSTGYGYYCYDVYDQNLKLVIVDKQKNTTRFPRKYQLGHILDYKQIQYFDRDSSNNPSYIAYIKNPPKDEKRAPIALMLPPSQTELFTFGLRIEKFSQIMNYRVNTLKNKGLNHIQLLYCQKYNLKNLQIAPQGENLSIPLQVQPQSNNDMQLPIQTEDIIQKGGTNEDIMQEDQTTIIYN